MNILTVPIDKLKPYENNPRHNEDAVDKVAESIREFGFLVPIVIDKDYVIAAGHTRLLAAQETASLFASPGVDSDCNTTSGEP